jgi:tRNA threonylcarbamoyladenosine dehydratase
MANKLLLHETVDRIIYSATLAPSPHNVQGWKFRFDGEKIEVLKDNTRKILKEIDPHEKEGLISIGAAMENLVIAAIEEGYKPSIDWFPGDINSGLVAYVRLEDGDQERHELYPLLEKRSVNRSKYKKTPVQNHILSELMSIAAEEGFELKIVTDPFKIKELANLAGEAGSIKFSHEETHRELHGLLRYTPKEAAVLRDGLHLESFFIPSPLARLAKYAMSWDFVRILNTFGYNRALAYFQETLLIKSSPAVALLVAKDDTAKNYINGGRVLQRIALAATKHGVSMQPHSAVADLGYSKEAGYHESVSENMRLKINKFTDKMKNIFGYSEDLPVINFFRLGYPTKIQKTSSTRRNLEEVLEIVNMNDSADFSYQELTTRNFPFINRDDQLKLKNSRIAIAGCGSIGGASLEILARMGAERLILAEPGTYELNNLNRQNATIKDIDKNKAEAILERIKQINPKIKGFVLSEGVTSKNVNYLVGSSEVIIDGVDITEEQAIRAKILLHQEAWRLKRPVICGYDIAGTQLVKIYDYRKGNIKPLDGKFEALDLNTITPLAFLSRVISPLDLPIEMLPVTGSMIRGSKASIPQLGPTAELFGVLSSWAALDILAGRPVRKKVLIDIPDVFRPVGTSVISGFNRIIGIIKLKLLLNKTKNLNKQQLVKTKHRPL